ncbi:Endonuclease-reverse transcriptase [Fasciola gigantica]|uniref:Endonuclease-reverse transcriptase n=1 Tax=Fasciola gigantica TaxID=46835 RepID=A0A504ZBZ9_FASGI|nr:Endonuclease-reverse transcriptase [Fasciola gigantica]
MHQLNWVGFIYLINLCQALKTVQHTIWLPAGKRLRVPCKLKNTEKVETPYWWAHLNADLRWNSTVNSVTVWYDRLGKMVHVGEVLFVHVPWFEASELAVTQYAPRETRPDEKRMNHMPEFRSWIGGTNQLLAINHLDTITCQQLQATTVYGMQEKWDFLKRRTQVISQTYFTFRIYVQPILIWSYAIPAEFEFANRSVLLKPVTEWCSAQRSIAHHRADVCIEVFEQRRPSTRQNKPNERLPMIQPTDLAYLELGLTIDITNQPLSMLADPGNGQLSYIHAQYKDSLDSYILREVTEEANRQEVDLPVIIATRLRAICPPGGHTFTPVPVLHSLQPKRTVSNNTKENNTINKISGSATVLVSWPIMCSPCRDGQAPRTGYAFDGCHYCPRGFYLGSTGWPSSAGCLPCPKGFTTNHVGASSIDECVLDAGAVTRWALGYLVNLWYALQKIMVGTPGPDTQTRALGRHQQSPWAWLGKTHKAMWIWGGLYVLVVTTLTALAVYRLHLYAKLHRIFRKQYRLLLKAALIGQINLVSHIKQRSRKDAGNPNPDDELDYELSEGSENAR